MDIRTDRRIQKKNIQNLDLGSSFPSLSLVLFPGGISSLFLLLFLWLENEQRKGGKPNAHPKKKKREKEGRNEKKKLKKDVGYGYKQSVRSTFFSIRDDRR